jgi:hypothetical protein
MVRFRAAGPRFSESGEWMLFRETALLMEKSDCARDPDGESKFRSDAAEAFG